VKVAADSGVFYSVSVVRPETARSPEQRVHEV